ncbi:beta-1,3-galactosyltransferase 5-like [Octopus vulgaris]|uniref:Beta-1,3-galactosyltransferase 5-like n=2 Tax=Octopus TaxID=6643 RepID=A0AA36B3C9_OCTVU|nr:beta-1,3-galactosyltransferase 2-like [Octopus sinensis]CAI9726177.1 beta-1,3-galactosyltransferase 5-like [Octopus vulgaris]
MRRLLNRSKIKRPLLLVCLGIVFLFVVHSTITNNIFNFGTGRHLHYETTAQIPSDLAYHVQKEYIYKKTLNNDFQESLAFRTAGRNGSNMNIKYAHTLQNISGLNITTKKGIFLLVQSSDNAIRNTLGSLVDDDTNTVVLDNKNVSAVSGSQSNISLARNITSKIVSVEQTTSSSRTFESLFKKINISSVNTTHSSKTITQKIFSNPTTVSIPKIYNPHPFYFRLDANELCSRRDPPFLLIVVPSIHDHMDIRNAIRQTWASVAKGHVWPGREVQETVKLAFLLGLHQFPERESLLIAESKKYGDIIQENFIDSYYNLSIKILMAMKWASHYCPGVNYILKADEDTFVNIPMLVEILRQPETPRHSIMGRIMPESKVYRFGRWKVDKKIYDKKVYPPYAAGNTYIIPGSIARKLFIASKYHVYLHVEDAFITGVLAQSIGASHFDIPGFTFQTDDAPEACDFIMDLKISSTKANMGLIRHIWSQIKKQKDCEE